MRYRVGKACVLLACLIAAAPVTGAASRAQAEGASVVVAARGPTTLVARFGVIRVRVTMLARQVQLKEDWRPPHPRNDCTYSRVPCSLTDRFEIFVQGRKIILPRSAIARLADIDTMRLSQRRRDRYRLRILGGDADGSYVVELLFDRNRILERVDIWPEGAQVVDRIFYRRAGTKIIEHVVHYKVEPLE